MQMHYDLKRGTFLSCNRPPLWAAVNELNFRGNLQTLNDGLQPFPRKSFVYDSSVDIFVGGVLPSNRELDHMFYLPEL
jgi:hypothetical protein